MNDLLLKTRDNLKEHADYLQRIASIWSVDLTKCKRDIEDMIKKRVCNISVIEIIENSSELDSKYKSTIVKNHKDALVNITNTIENLQKQESDLTKKIRVCLEESDYYRNAYNEFNRVFNIQEEK